MNKTAVFFMVMLLIPTIVPFSALAGDEGDPEIEDILGDARDYLDVDKAWFYEDSSNPDLLYTVIKLAKPSSLPLKQHLTIHWEMNGEIYWTMCGMGYGGDEKIAFFAGEGYDYWYDRAIVHDVTGEIIEEQDGLVTCIVPKEFIGDPQPGDVLTKTECECFQRFGLWGRLGFAPILRIKLFIALELPFLQVEDFAPDNDFDDIKEYGKDYVIQY